MIRGDERYWANMVLDVIENVECPMLMYEGEKMIVRKALKAYLADRKTESDSEKPNNCETCIWSICNYNKVPWDTDCNGCKFVGTYDTEFPCANCSRKTKDYYAKTEPQTERE